MILWFVYCPQMFPLLGRMITEWYTGSNENAFAELCQGVDARSKTLEENLGLYELAEKIRTSDELSRLFQEHESGDFFAALAAATKGGRSGRTTGSTSRFTGIADTRTATSPTRAGSRTRRSISAASRSCSHETIPNHRTSSRRS
jgi:hypothetical protein